MPRLNPKNKQSFIARLIASGPYGVELENLLRAATVLDLSEKTKKQSCITENAATPPETGIVIWGNKKIIK